MFAARLSRLALFSTRRGSCNASAAVLASPATPWTHLVAIALLFAAACGTALAAGGPPPLLGPASAAEIAQFNQSVHLPEAALARQQPVAVNFGNLQPASGAPPSQISVDIFGEQTITVNLERIETRGAGNYTWYGRVQGYPAGRATLTVVDGAIAGTIDLGTTGRAHGSARQYQIQTRGDGLQLLREIDPDAFPPDHPPGGEPVAPAARRLQVGPTGDAAATGDEKLRETKADSGSTIDILVVYSNQTAAAAGAAVGAQIQQAVDTTNTVYANSGINTRLRLVNYQQVNYDESGDYPTDLNWLGSNSGVTSLRNTYGADLVSMFVESGQYCGYGWIGASASSAFTVVNRGCASGNYSFPHEIGHNFGARHDTYVDSTPTPYAYGHGYVECTQSWRDVMAYPTQCGGTRIAYLSNPNLAYGSPPLPLGSTSTANVTKVHNDNAYTVANFRGSVTPTSGGCSYGLSPSSASAGAASTSGSVAVTAGTGCAWNAASNASWLTIGAGSGTSASGTLYYGVAANSGPARSGAISVGGALFTVSQASGCSFALSPTGAGVAAAGGTGSTALTTDAACAWTASSSASWLTVTSSTSGSGSTTVGYSVAANTGSSTRTANLSVGGATFVVTQDAATITTATAPNASLSATSLNFGSVLVGKTSSAKSATLTNTGGSTLTISSLTPAGNAGDFSGSGNCTAGTNLAAGQSCTLTYTFTPAATGTRTATLAIATNANSPTLTLTGSGKNRGRK